MPEDIGARRRCYHDIRGVAMHGLMKYYDQHPERIVDSRAQDALKWSTEGIAKILAILDEYEIGDTPASLARAKVFDKSPTENKP
jgi:hypothetical protein